MYINTYMYTYIIIILLYAGFEHSENLPRVKRAHKFILA